MSRSWEANVRKVVPYVPGEQPKLPNLVKLNTNENPYPPSPAVRKVLEEMNTDDLRLYPDPAADALVDAFAEVYGLEKDQVFTGVGSDDVLAMSFLTFFNSDQPILFPDITYSFYDVWADLFRIPYKQIPLDENFVIRPEDYTIRNGGSLQFYTAQCNTVVDGTDFIHSASIKSWGQPVYGSISNHWYMSFVNNRLSDCNYYHYAGWYMDPKLPGASFLCVFGEGDDTTNMAMTMRGNSLEYNSAVNMRGGECPRGVEDLVIDSNRFDSCRCAIYAEGGGTGIFIHGNEFVNCAKKAGFTDPETEKRALFLDNR